MSKYDCKVNFVENKHILDLATTERQKGSQKSVTKQP